jgi:hypothetical protein
MNGAIARIGLRYGIGILVGAGWLGSEVGSQISSDPDIITLVDYAGLVIAGAIVEGWYWLAKRWEWTT